MGLLAFIILLPVIVFVHEFGHFLFARINGVKVESFSIGFGWTLFSWTDKYKTVWKVSAIPLGGYVKMLGQSDTPESAEEKNKKIKLLSPKERSESFEFKKRYQKAAIVAAGPLFNFIFGFLVFFMLFLFIGVPKTTSVIIDIQKDSPAYIAGFQKEDSIISIDGIQVNHPSGISEVINSSNGKKLKFEVARDGKVVEIFATAKKTNDKYLLGISYGSRFNEYKKLGFIDSITNAYSEISYIVSQTTKSLFEILTGSRSSKELGGMISIAKVSGDALSAGFYSFMYLIALLSISLGLFNLFPIPVLDGGYLFIYLIEGILGHDLSDKIKEKMFFIGFMFIIFLLLLSNINDIIRMFE